MKSQKKKLMIVRFLINFATSGKYTEQSELGLSDNLIRYALINFTVLLGCIVLGAYTRLFFLGKLYRIAGISVLMLIICLVAFILARTKIPQFAPAMIILAAFFFYCIYIVYMQQIAGANFLFVFIYPMISIIFIGLIYGVILSVILLVVVFIEMVIPGLSQFNYHFDTSTRMLASYLLILFFMTVIEYTRKTKDSLIDKQATELRHFNNHLRRAFSTYLSEDVVEKIISDPTRLLLGGINRHMTAMFTDIKDFTAIAEALEPIKLVDLLNYYLSAMSDIILEQKGTIDKYQGDAIMSFFGAPLELSDHALKACITAILMKRKEKEINDYIKEKNISPILLHTRIGINSGDMIVGNMGTQKKMNYTIISNAVNLASRLEGINKQYGTWILASENTIKETHGKLVFRRLDRIRVVGINAPVRIYEILETKENATDKVLEKAELFNKAIDHFEARNWTDTIYILNKILKIFPEDGPSLLYMDRICHFQKNKPEKDWDGVFNMVEK